MDTRTPIHDALNAIEHPFDAFHRHHDNQEQPMSRLTDAKAAVEIAVAKLGTLASNPFADFLIDNGLGTNLTTEEIQLVASMIHALERAHHPVAAPQNPAPAAPQQQPAGTAPQQPIA
jgi:hypothetical protein